MHFKSLLQQKLIDEPIADSDDFSSSRFGGLTDFFKSAWNEIVYCMTRADQVETHEDDQIHETYNFLEQHAERVEDLNGEVSTFLLDDFKLALIRTGDVIGMAIRKKDVEEFVNMI